MTDQANGQSMGPMYEYLMGTIDMADQSWMQIMQDRLNAYGTGGWCLHKLHQLDQRYMLLVLIRSYPAATMEAPARPEEEAPPPEPAQGYQGNLAALAHLRPPEEEEQQPAAARRGPPRRKR